MRHLQYILSMALVRLVELERKLLRRGSNPELTILRLLLRPLDKLDTRARCEPL